MLALLERRGITRGYGGYWNSHGLTWRSRFRVFVAPVSQCGPTGRQLCRSNITTIDSWYEPRPGPSFLIVDPSGIFVTRPWSPAGARPTEVHRFGRITVFFYDRDLAEQIERR